MSIRLCANIEAEKIGCSQGNERTNAHTHTTEIIDAEAGHRGVDDSPLDSRNFRVFRL